MKVIEPGPIKTDFYDRSADVMSRPRLTVYDGFVAKLMPKLQKAVQRHRGRSRGQHDLSCGDGRTQPPAIPGQRGWRPGPPSSPADQSVHGIGEAPGSPVSQGRGARLGLENRPFQSQRSTWKTRQEASGGKNRGGQEVPGTEHTESRRNQRNKFLPTKARRPDGPVAGFR